MLRSHLKLLRSSSRAIHTTPILCRQRYKRFGDQITPTPSTTSSYNSTLYSVIKGNRFDPKRFSNGKPPWIIIVVGAGATTYYLAHLERVPGSENNRTRFMDVNETSERQMGQESLNQILSQYRAKILGDRDRRTILVKKVVKRLVESNGLTTGQGDWDVYVIDENQKNAFVLPGGHIFVFTGILPITATEDGLAIVLGHELAHQVARHPAERMSSLKILFALSLLLSSLGVDFGLSRVLLNLLMTLPNSRTAETEADFIGLKLANNACYPPEASVGLWQRMSASEQSSSAAIGFLSTHPTSERRIVECGRHARSLSRPTRCEDFKKFSVGRIWD